jgi:hypothetical protein
MKIPGTFLPDAADWLPLDAPGEVRVVRCGRRRWGRSRRVSGGRPAGVATHRGVSL